MAPATRSNINKTNNTIPNPEPRKKTTQTTPLGASTKNPHLVNPGSLIPLILHFLSVYCPATFKNTTAQDLGKHFEDHTVKSLEYKQNDKTVYIVGQMMQKPTRSDSNYTLEMQYLFRKGANVGPKAKKTPRRGSKANKTPRRGPKANKTPPRGPKPSYPAILEFLEMFKEDENYSFSNKSWVSVSLDNALEGENLKKLQNFYEEIGFVFDGREGFATVETIEQKIKSLMLSGE